MELQEIKTIMMQALKKAGSYESPNIENVSIACSTIYNSNEVLKEDMFQLFANLPVTFRICKDTFGAANPESIEQMGFTGQQVLTLISNKLNTESK